MALALALLMVPSLARARVERPVDLQVRQVVDSTLATSLVRIYRYDAPENPPICPASSRSAAVPVGFCNYDDLLWSFCRQFTAKLRDYESGLNLDYFGARYYAGAMGRFTSADAPLADQHAEDPQSWNLYSYVRNYPLAMVDLEGRDALWVVDKRAGQTTLRIPVKFEGADATKQNFAAIEKRVNSLTIVGSPVKVEVVVTDKKINGVRNKLDFSPGLDYKKYPTAGEGINKLGGKKGHIDSSQPTGVDAAAHDILHFAGIKDQYIEGKPTSSGQRTSTPTPGYTNENIMTSRQGTELDASQIQEAKSNRSTKECTIDANGKTKCR